MGERIYLFAYKPKGDKHPLKLHNIEHYANSEYYKNSLKSPICARKKWNRGGLHRSMVCVYFVGQTTTHRKIHDDKLRLVIKEK